jgi:hypothetical protein
VRAALSQARAPRLGQPVAAAVARDAAARRCGSTEAALEAALARCARPRPRPNGTGVTLAPTTAAPICWRCGASWSPARADEADTAALRAALLADLPALIDAFAAMRAEEGAALAAIGAQIDRIAALTEDAARCAEEPPRRDGRALAEALAAIWTRPPAGRPARGSSRNSR